jgi:NAD+ synthase (glutamine-hydrolysing)
VRNVAALLCGGEVSFVQQKMLLPFYDVFDEQRYFEPAAAADADHARGPAAGHHDLRGCLERQGLLAAAAVSGRPGRRADAAVGDLLPPIATPSAGHPEYLGLALLAAASAAAAGDAGGAGEAARAFVAMVNQVGGNDSLIFDGSSIVIAPDG